MDGEPFVGLTLARILRPWGRRGEVAAEILTDFPKRLTNLRDAWLSGNSGSARHVDIRSCRIHLGQAIFHFQGVESISDAERLRGLEVQVPFADRAPIPAGRHYISELIGCTVREQGQSDSPTAMDVGVVQDVQRVDETQGSSAAESWVLSVATSQGELLIPFAAEICVNIDTAARQIEVRLPDGLRGLNQS